MKIEIQRNETSQPIIYDGYINAYTKGPMYCVLFEKDGKRFTHKYPLCSIFRVIEDYEGSKRPAPAGSEPAGSSDKLLSVASEAMDLMGDWQSQVLLKDLPARARESWLTGVLPALNRLRVVIREKKAKA